MRSRDEEKLMQCAFGEMSPNDVAAVEGSAQADPATREALQSYRGIRDGLRSLANEVPSHQLSNERLRQAILARGLSPTKPQPSSWLGWLWMPVAAASVALALYMVRPTPKISQPLVALQSQNPFVVPKITGSQSGENLALAVREAESRSRLVDQASAALDYRSGVSESASASIKPVFVEKSVRLTRRHRAPYNSPDEASFAFATSPGQSGAVSTPSAVADAPASGSGRMLTKAMAAPTPMVGSAPESASIPAPHPIVLIDSQRDETTGAPRATEVGNPSNVIVGG